MPVVRVGDRRSTTSFQPLLVCVIAREEGEGKKKKGGRGSSALIHRDEEKTSFDVNYRSKR